MHVTIETRANTAQTDLNQKGESEGSHTETHPEIAGTRHSRDIIGESAVSVSSFAGLRLGFISRWGAPATAGSHSSRMLRFVFLKACASEFPEFKRAHGESPPPPQAPGFCLQHQSSQVPWLLPEMVFPRAGLCFPTFYTNGSKRQEPFHKVLLSQSWRLFLSRLPRVTLLTRRDRSPVDGHTFATPAKP